MSTYKYLEITKNDQVATVWLNRPEVRNAFHEGLISEITQAFNELAKENLRLVILRGNGPTFCAGADLNWMKNVADYSLEQNLTESHALSTCFATIYKHPHPTLALVHGAAIGGANGLIASCDLAYGEEDAVFSLSEVKIGIVPACISPYIIKRIG
ncbi:MAG: enoyl-CoA hydratase/isomerase family protein, partial [Cytophagales bacterium]|nr:enoyl-CoA hydratase/isomerase family protein [Cytophagales bacterium]